MTSDARGTEPLSWATWREGCRVLCARHHLRQTVTIALVVGTVLFGINQLDVVLRGDATPVVWARRR